MRDFTEPKSFYHSVFDHAGTAMMILSDDLTISTLNREAEKLTGYSGEEKAGRLSWNRIVETREGFACSLPTIPDSFDSPRSCEAHLTCRDGEVKHVLIKFSSLPGTGRTIVCLTDIAQYKETDKALQDKEEIYRLLVENASEGILIDQRGAIKFPNPKALEILGYSIEELKATKLTDLLHPQDIPLIEELHRQDNLTRDRTSTLRFRSKAGTELWLEVKAVPIVWENASAFLHLFKDVTLQKKLEAQLLHAQKMEAIGTLAGGIAHNFNNLLMAIQGNVSLMLLDTKPQSPHAERLTLVENLIESGSRLTSQLLGYAKGGKHEFQITNLNRLVEETSQTFGLTKKEIEIQLDLSHDLTHVMADRAQIQEVLMNLFVNAADAMPKGGDLFVTTRNVTDKALRDKPFKAPPGNYALVEVRDTGNGVDKKIMSRIFDPFFTTKPPGCGTGLGLASAYGIVKSHGGYIDANSEEGSGACFSIYLPSTESRKAGYAPEPSEPIRGAETLLLVDDEEDVLEVARLMLEKLNYRVLATKSGKEAIELFSGTKDSIDLAILDMVMPDMGGGMLYEKLKEIDPNIKALLSSGYGIDGQAVEIMKKGCNGFIQKPFGLADLSAKVRSILDGS
jgi:two-component system, cell cycle sensor histidine kinase and response regulator CckA